MATTRTIAINVTPSTTPGRRGREGAPGKKGRGGGGGGGNTTIINVGSGVTYTPASESNTTHTAALTDLYTLIDCSNISGCVITIPTDATIGGGGWPNTSEFAVLQSGTNQVSFVGAAGVTIDPNADSAKTRKIGTILGIKRKAAANSWVVFGDMEYDLPATSVQANATNATAAPTAVAATADGERFARKNGILVWEGEWATDTGTQNALACAIPTNGTFTPQDGITLVGVRAAFANNSTTPTFAPNGGTALTITKNGNQPLALGDIYGAGHECLLRYVAATPRWELLNPAGASSGAVTKIIPQSAHGFSVGNVVRLNGTSTYTKALADSSAHAEVAGIVSTVIDSNNFVLTVIGYVTGLSALTAQTVYFLDPSTAGAMTATEPSAIGQVSKPVFVADSATSGYFFNWRGEVISAAVVPVNGQRNYGRLVQSQTAQGNGATQTLTLGATPTVGNVLFALINCGTGFVQPTLSQTNVTWTKIAQVTSGTSSDCELWKGVVGASPGSALTVTRPSGTMFYATTLMEWSGVAGTLVTSVSNSQNSNMLTDLGGTGITPTAGCLMFLIGSWSSGGTVNLMSTSPFTVSQNGSFTYHGYLNGPIPNLTVPAFIWNPGASSNASLLMAQVT